MIRQLDGCACLESGRPAGIGQLERAVVGPAFVLPRVDARVKQVKELIVAREQRRANRLGTESISVDRVARRKP